MWLKFIILFSFSTSLWAYKLTPDFQKGFYWSETPISITVIDSDAARKDKIQTLAQTAIDDWQTRSGLQLWDYVGTGTKNIIRWSNDFARETNMDPNSVLAVAIRYTNGPYFAKTEIVINGSHTYNQNDALLRTTLTHELGHTMGLDHSEVSQAVMAPSLQPWYSGLHSDDLNGIQEAFRVMEERQVTGYVSPLSYENETSTPTPMTCGSVGPVAPTGSGFSVNGIVSLAGGLLISFVRKLVQWFKSRL